MHADRTPPPPPGSFWRGPATALLLLAALAAGIYWFASRLGQPETPFAGYFELEMASLKVDDVLSRLRKEWTPESPIMVLEISSFFLESRKRQTLDNLASIMGLPDGTDHHEIYRWCWTRPAPDPALLSAWRQKLYTAFSRPSLAEYFAGNPPHAIRADEIRWGGVIRDGIPPLRGPVMVPANEADYLADDNLVFGLLVNGEARAYPRRILGAHEMVTDTVGGVAITGVYCPLCEMMIAYRSRLPDGREFTFGTSGFLYRSNKLMYDNETLSLWQTATGEPAVGELVGKGIRLASEPVVTTTWKDWRAAHPGTKVIGLSDLGTDYTYPEGAAYRQYFAIDELMFDVPSRDGRLKNKDQVFAPDPASAGRVALSAGFLAKNPVYNFRGEKARLVIVTSPGGANRAYQAGGHSFRPGQPNMVLDEMDSEWRVTETALLPKKGKPLPRVGGHRAFWFAWHAAFPEGRLVKE